MVSFKNPELLSAIFLMPAVLALFIHALIRKRQIKSKLGITFQINNLIQGYSPFFYRLRFSLLILSLSLIIISAANPVRESNVNSDQIKSIDIIIAIDASNSMLCNDIMPSRLEVSKNIVDKLLNELGNDRIGIISFGGKPFLQLPVTADIEAAKMYISSISTDAVPEQGTAIGKALKLCNSSLNLPEKKASVVILFSDGEDHDPTALAEAKQLNEHGIVLFTIGSGTVQGSEIIEKETGEIKKDENGRIIVSSLNEPLLKEIAAIAKGKYFYSNDLRLNTRALLNEINKLRKKTLTDSDEARHISYYWLFLVAAIVLLVIEIFIPEFKRRSNSLL